MSKLYYQSYYLILSKLAVSSYSVLVGPVQSILATSSNSVLAVPLSKVLRGLTDIALALAGPAPTVLSGRGPTVLAAPAHAVLSNPVVTVAAGVGEGRGPVQGDRGSGWHIMLC